MLEKIFKLRGGDERWLVCEANPPYTFSSCILNNFYVMSTPSVHQPTEFAARSKQLLSLSPRWSQISSDSPALSKADLYYCLELYLVPLWVQR